MPAFSRISAPAAALAVLSAVCMRGTVSAAEYTAVSPDRTIAVTVSDEGGRCRYSVMRGGEVLVRPSALGFVFADGIDLDGDLSIVSASRSSCDSTWEQPWGERRIVRDLHNELTVSCARRDGRRTMRIVFRVFDDGVGFRYELPAAGDPSDFLILGEKTEFALSGDDTAWWIPAFEDNRYEYLYTESPISAAGAVHTPLTLRTSSGIFLSIHEAALTDWASMALQSGAGNVLTCRLFPWSDGVAVRVTTPAVSPWRTITIAGDPGGLITSTLILNLNEPSRIADTSWIRPGKYIGIWWGMHIGKYTWGSGPKHGATTANTERYIDFAAKHGFSGVLVEGWNLGWDGNWFSDGSGFRFTIPHEDFDIEEICRYAAERGVYLIGHHETGADIDNYERQLEAAFSYYERLGVRAVKTGYVGNRTNEFEWHHGQYMVRHYRKVVETAAAHHIMLIVHEPIKDTGIRRTWPNMLSREGARGQEYNAWSGDGGNPPDHTTILPFTRMLAGPFDFTPGIFDLFFEGAGRPNNRVNTTLTKQLALYIVIYSPMQMAADLPENYEGHPAFRFIEEVPTDWETSEVLNASIGDYVTIARRERGSGEWYIGSITDENGRILAAPLDFLDRGRMYRAVIWADAPDADWQENPLAWEVTSTQVDAGDTLEMRLAPGGGQAIRLIPLD